MLNVAGASFDFGNVLFAVLQECEHVRRGLLPNEAHGRLMEAARRKLAQIRESYVEHGGTPGYWEELEREVLETSLPAYLPEAIEQTRLEKSGYDVWRRGDAGARALFALLGLVIGALVALSLTPLLKAQLFGVSAQDPVTFLAVASGLLLTALAAAYIPARRAMSVDPVNALRN